MTTRVVCIGIAMSIAALLVLPAIWAREERVSLDQVPAPVMAAVKARFGDAVVKGAGKETEKGKLVYEITLEDKGHNVDVTLTPGGDLLLIERSVEESALPPPVAATLEDPCRGRCGPLCRGRGSRHRCPPSASR